MDLGWNDSTMCNDIPLDLQQPHQIIAPSNRSLLFADSKEERDTEFETSFESSRSAGCLPWPTIAPYRPDCRHPPSVALYMYASNRAQKIAADSGKLVSGPIGQLASWITNEPGRRDLQVASSLFRRPDDRSKRKGKGNDGRQPLGRTRRQRPRLAIQ